MAKNSLDKARGYDMMKLIKPVGLVPAERAISFLGLPKDSSDREVGSTSTGVNQVFRHFHFKGKEVKGVDDSIKKGV